MSPIFSLCTEAAILTLLVFYLVTICPFQSKSDHTVMNYFEFLSSLPLSLSHLLLNIYPQKFKTHKNKTQ